MKLLAISLILSFDFQSILYIYCQIKKRW